MTRPHVTVMLPLLTLLLTGAAAFAGDDRDQDKVRRIDVPREWADAEQFDRVHEAAQKSGRLLAVIVADRDSQDKNHHPALVRMFNESSLRGAARVFLGDNSPPDAIAPAIKAVKSKASIPRLYLITPQGQIAGFVSRGSIDNLSDVVGLATQVVAWQEGVTRKLTAADRLAAAGRFRAALDEVAKITREDTAISNKVRLVIEPTDDDKKKDDKDKDKKDDDRRDNRRERNREPEAPPPPSGPPMYYPTLETTKTDEYRKLAAERLATAKKHLAENNPAAARTQLAPMVADAADFPEVEEAKTLLQQAATATK